MGRGKSSSTAAHLVQRRSNRSATRRFSKQTPFNVWYLMVADRNRLVQHPRMNRFLFFSLVVLPISLYAQGLPDKAYIYVVGRAEVAKTADMVELHFDVVTRGPDETKVNQDVQSKANKVLALLDSKKVPTDDVVAETLKSQPEFEQQDNSPPNRGRVSGYSVTRPFHVKIRDIKSFPKLVDELLTITGVEFLSIQGALSKQREIQDQMSEKALANARVQADKMLKPFQQKIDSVFAISPVQFPQIQGDIFSPAERVVVTGGIPAMQPEEASHYRLAPVTVSESVHVIYLISPAK